MNRSCRVQWQRWNNVPNRCLFPTRSLHTPGHWYVMKVIIDNLPETFVLSQLVSQVLVCSNPLDNTLMLVELLLNEVDDR